MHKLSRFLFALSLMLACSFITAAQEKSQANSIPKVLQITREYTKPYRAGMVHNASESAFVRAMANAKWPTHYLGMTSLSGKQRALFLTSYASLEAWEKDGAAVEKNPTLSAAVEAAGVADGAELESVDQGVFVFNEEMSLRSMADLSQMRFMEVSIYHVRPGHEREWSEAVKMVKAAYEKGVPGSHWGVFNQVYGGEGGSYLVLTARKTLAEVDRGFQVENKQFEAAIGADGMKKLDELIAASVESSLHQLFAFNPHMSYAADEWIKADPDFWKP
jgi:hypothetical protein